MPLQLILAGGEVERFAYFVTHRMTDLNRINVRGNGLVRPFQKAAGINYGGGDWPTQGKGDGSGSGAGDGTGAGHDPCDGWGEGHSMGGSSGITPAHITLLVFWF